MRLIFRFRPLAAVVAALVIATPLAAAAVVAAPPAGPGSAPIPSTIVKKLAAPTSPADDDPGALAQLGSPNGPDDDLLAALADLAGAADVATASAARGLALDVLEGNPIAGRVYSGIPLLDWNLPARIKTVPAGGTVQVSEVRFADRTISDTALLRFEDPSQPFRIAFRIAELDGRFGGSFNPASLRNDGTASSVTAQPLTLPNMPTGTREINKFHPAGAPEATRLAVQELVVPMPAPGALAAIVDPDMKAGVNAITTLAPATAERITAIETAHGFSGSTPTDAEKTLAISKLSPNAPAKLLWSALHDLDPTSPGFLAAAHTAGTQNRPLVDALRTHNALPAGLANNAGATVAIALAGGEAYASRVTVRGPGTITVSLANSDTFARSVAIRTLHDRRGTVGATDWGDFGWATATTVPLAPGELRTVSVALTSGAFAMWIGDPDGGDQAGTVVQVDTSPPTTSLRLANNTAMPSHIAEDAHGNLWVALVGADSIARMQPANDASQSTIAEFRLPGGASDPQQPGIPLAPHDLAIDMHGIVWVTLGLGNAIARIDPAAVHANTTDGIRLYPLDACTVPAPACGQRVPPPPAPEPPTRLPNQMKVMTAPNGDTIMWFTESNANTIGVMRVAPDGTPVASAHFPCGCGEPLGIGLAADGSVWFTTLVGNELVRLRPSPSLPFDPKAAAVDRFSIPSSVEVIDPAHPEPGIETAGAHSLAVDQAGRIWFTEEETAKIGFLDPALARSGTTAGITEYPLGTTVFGVDIQPADLSVAADGTVFWVDEYGDVVGSATAAGTIRKWLPAERASNTDAPIIDSKGNLWFSEAGSSLVTRIAGVGAPTLPPSTPPPTITADTVAGTVSGAGVRGAALVDVEVLRAGAVVIRAANTGVDAGQFSALTPGLAAGDVVRVVARGSRPQSALEFTVAELPTTVAPDGLVLGHARTDGKPLAGTVNVNAAGSPVDVSVGHDGSFISRVPAGTTTGLVLASGSTVAAVFQTISGISPAPVVAPPNPGPVDTPRPPVSGNLLPHGAGPLGGSGDTSNALERACEDKLWLVDGTAPFLGLTSSQLTDCLGPPTRVARRHDGSRWYYGKAIDFRIRHDIVSSIGVHDGTFRTDVDDVAVGMPLWQASTALHGLRYDTRAKRFRVVLAQPDGRFADIFIPPGRGRKPKIDRITITRVRRSGLDRFGRRLAQV